MATTDSLEIAWTKIQVIQNINPSIPANAPVRLKHKPLNKRP